MAVIIPIGVDTSGLTRGLSQGTSGLRRFGKMAAFVGGAAALGGLVAVLKVGIDEFGQAQKVIAQTGAVLKSTGGVANVTAGRIDSMAMSLMKLTGVDDETIAAGENLLLTFTKIRNETGKGNKIFDQATLAMVNLSVAMGKDMNASAILVGKALNDPVKGVGALSKAGVQFTASQKETIKALVESGDTMTAQKMILKELETQFGGSAKAAGQTLPGQLNILKETFRNTAEGLVTTFIPYLSRATKSLLDFMRQFSKQPTFFAKVTFTIGLLTDAAGKTFKNLLQWWDKSKSDISPTSGIVNIRISGRAQFDKFFTNLETSAYNLGVRIGKGMVTLLFGVFTSEGRGKIVDMMSSFKGFMMSAGEKVFRLTGTSLLSALMNGIVDGIGEQVAIFGSAFKDLLTRSILNAVKSLPGPIADAVTAMFYQAGVAVARKGKVAFRAPFKIIIVDPINEAIKTARASLAGLGSEIGGFLARIGAASGKSKEAAAIRKRLKDEGDARDRARLTEAVAMAETDDDRATAIRELSDFEANLRADDLDRQVQEQQDTNQTNIDNLIQSFNDGAIGAEEFATRLNNIIGADFGDSLGIAFVAGFKGAIANLLTEIQGIATGIVGAQAPAGSSVAGAQSDVAISATEANQAKEEKYAEAVRQHKRDRAERLERAENARRAEGSRAGRRIDPGERAEIHEIMRLWDKDHKPPKRETFGLAQGGILKRQVFTAGEAGREAVIPLGSSEAMNILRQAVGGGGGSTTTYNVTVNAGMGADGANIGREIVEAVKVFERRNGPVFSNA